MSLSQDEQKKLTAIGKGLANDDPKLAYLLTHWRRPPISMSIKRRPAVRNKTPQTAHRSRQLPHRTQVILLTSGVIGAIGTTIALFAVMMHRPFASANQSTLWMVGYFAVMSTGSYLVINQADRVIRLKDLGQRLADFALGLLFLAATIFMVTLIPSIL